MTGSAELNRDVGAASLRADARRNRAQIVAAAEEAFHRDGPDVSMAEIARRAGVGLTTLLRRFPARDDLLDEVLRTRVEQCAADLRTAREDPDPWHALRALVTTFCARLEAGGGLAPALTAALVAHDQGNAYRQVLHDLDELLDRAKARGAVAADVTAGDVLLLLEATAGLIATSRPEGRGSRSSRVVELLLRSLRPDAT